MNQIIIKNTEIVSGRSQAELVLKNGKFFDVFTGELIHGDMAVHQGQIVGIGQFDGVTEEDLEGRIAVPGLIDAHVHIESSLHSPSGFARLTVPAGTTTVIADPHEIANVKGMDGIRWLLDASEHVPQSVFVMLPSCVPALPFEDAGAVLEADDLADLIDHPRVLGLGEMMDFPGLAAGETGIVSKIAMARSHQKKVDGHCPGMTARELEICAAAGIGTDHECTDLPGMKKRLQLGMRVLIREGTAARDLAALIGGVSPGLARRCAFCTDDKHPGDILDEGHIDFNVREAIRRGLNPADAVRLATLNGAEAYGLNDRGALCPGRRADIAVLEGRFEDFQVQSVYQNGIKAAQNGRLLTKIKAVDDSAVRNTVCIPSAETLNLDLKPRSDSVRVMTLSPGTLMTGDEVRTVKLDAEGRFIAGNGLIKLAVAERHQCSGQTGLGILEGFGLEGGAIASSIAHDSHNLIAAGDDDAAITAAFRALADCGGGIALAASGGRILGMLPLPLGGLMTDAPARQTAEKLNELKNLAYRELHVKPELDPFMPLSFLALPVIPKLKLTSRGLYDVNRSVFVEL